MLNSTRETSECSAVHNERITCDVLPAVILDHSFSLTRWRYANLLFTDLIIFASLPEV